MTKQKILHDWIILFVLAFLMRYIYSLFVPNPVVTPDTHGYYSTGQRMLKTLEFADDSRPPVYPVFLNLTVFSLNNYLPDILTPDFFKGARLVVLIQYLLGIISILIFYRVLLFLSFTRLESFIISLLLGSNIMIFANEPALLTESLAVFYLVTVAYLSLKLFRRPTADLYVLLFFLFSLGMFLKPLYILLPAVILFLNILYQKKKLRTFLTSSLILSLLIFLVFLYVSQNRRYNQYNGISRIGDIDLLGQILYFNLPVDDSKNIPSLYNKVIDYRRAGLDPMPFRFLEYQDPQIYNKIGVLNSISRFNRQVIFHNFPAYVIRSLSLIPKALVSGNDMFAYSPKSNSLILAGFFNCLYRFYFNLQYLTFIAIPFYPVTLWLFVRHKSLETALLALTGTLFFFNLAGTVFFVYYDFGRLLSVSQPVAYAFSFYWWKYLILKLKRMLLP